MADIADILASVDRDAASAAGDRDSRNVYVPEAAAVDHQVLTRFWVAERGAPEVLPWPGKLMERVMQRVRRQISTIEDLSLSADGSSSSTSSSSANLNLKLCILQSDLSRTQYLVRSLLRQRLAKLTKYNLHYLRLSAPAEFSGSQPSQTQSQSQSQSQSQEQATGSEDSNSGSTLVSAQELAFLRTHYSLMSAHYSGSFLGGFPPALRRLDDNTGGTTMVTAPETKEVVFVRCLGETVRIVVPGEQQQQTQTQTQQYSTTATRGAAAGGRAWPKQEVLGYGATMKKGEVWVVRWEGIREAWEAGDVEVL